MSYTVNRTERTPVALDCLRIRWINCQCHEIRLPNGKYIVTDPYVKDALPGHCPPHKTPFQVEDFEGCDYAILQHTHFDHDFSAGDLYKRFGCTFIVHEQVALELGKCFDIPFSKIIALPTQGEFDLEDFTLHMFKGYHRMNRWISGLPSQTRDGGQENFGFYGHEQLEPMGTVFNTSYVLTTRENYRIAFVAGDHMDDVLRNVAPLAPNLLIRQLIDTPEETAEVCVRTGAQIMLPSHYEGTLLRGTEDDVSAQIDKINELIRAKGGSCRAFYPDRYRWYNIYTGIDAE